MTAGDPTPLLRVVRGEPSPEELAALTAVIATRGTHSKAHEPRSQWTDRASLVRRAVYPGPGVWVASGWAPGIRTRADW
jgi:acyl-CoA carboxylase epsilon subunit